MNMNTKMYKIVWSEGRNSANACACSGEGQAIFTEGTRWIAEAWLDTLGQKYPTYSHQIQSSDVPAAATLPDAPRARPRLYTPESEWDIYLPAGARGFEFRCESTEWVGGNPFASALAHSTKQESHQESVPASCETSAVAEVMEKPR